MSTPNISAPSLSVLIVDDELNIRKTLAICLETDGHQVTAVSNAADAFAEIQRRRFDLCFLDVRLGAESGLDALPKLLEACPWLKVVMITAHASIDSAVEAMRRGAFDYVPKPFAVAQITAAVKKVQVVQALEAEVKGLKERLSGGSGEAELESHSTKMQKALDLARDVAESDATVLVTGENGTGKGVLARAIHRWSSRAKGPLGVVSCPSLSAELLESELFGHVKGAFTGAIRDNPGRITACDGGTLFLDEVGDLPLALQPKLLRFLQDRDYEAVGSNVTRHADVRVVAATNLNMADAVRAGKFREDLFYRLNVIQIELPSLRERREDIPLLANRFLAQLAKGKPLVGFTDKALAHLMAHDWPGNVRELRNVVERAVILSHGRFVEPRHLTLMTETRNAPDRLGDMVSLEQVEETHIRRVLGVARSMEEAARILGIDTVTLWRRRKKYRI